MDTIQLVLRFGLIGYALLGSTWLMMKTEGELHTMAQRWSRRLVVLLLLAMVVVSVWTSMLDAVNCGTLVQFAHS